MVARVPAARGEIGRLHLTENLGFTQHQGIQPAGDAHHVAQCLAIAVGVTGTEQLRGRHLVGGGQPVAKGGETGVADGVDFGAVAGGQNGDLVQRQGLPRTRQVVGEVVCGEGDPFAQRHRSGCVAEPEHLDGHGRLRRCADARSQLGVSRNHRWRQFVQGVVATIAPI